MFRVHSYTLCTGHHLKITPSLHNIIIAIALCYSIASYPFSCSYTRLRLTTQFSLNSEKYTAYSYINLIVMSESMRIGSRHGTTHLHFKT